MKYVDYSILIFNVLRDTLRERGLKSLQPVGDKMPLGEDVTNRNLRQILTTTFPDALEGLRQGEAIAQISDRP